MGDVVADRRTGRAGAARTAVHLAREGAALAGTVAAGPAAVGVRVARTGLARWRHQRAVLAEDTRARRAALAEAVSPRQRRRRWPWVLGALALLGGAAAVTTLARPTPPPPPAAHPPRVGDPAPAAPPTA